MLKLFDVLDEHDDVQNVYGKYEIDEAEVKRGRRERQRASRRWPTA